jgi:hypothetical protein
MPWTVSNKCNLFRMHNREQGLRTIIVLIFAAAIGVMLLISPGRLFKDAAKSRHFSAESNKILPMPVDEHAVALNRRATAALEALRTHGSNER